MDTISLLYIDDRPDPALSKYLHQYNNPNYNITSHEILFAPSDGYESLILNPTVQTANIIFIDSRLFENRTVEKDKFTGEEFKMILKKYYPFIEVLVITQNGEDASLGTISKFDPSTNSTAEEYYAKHLPPYIENAIKNILIFRRLGDKLSLNDSWEIILKEKIINSLKGIGTYDELTKSDIDALIKAFTVVQENLDA